MFPQLNLDEIIEDEINEEEEETQGINYLFDFDKGDFVIKDGRLVEADRIEGIKIWVEKLLLTEEFKYQIYDETEYGTTIRKLILGRKVPQLLLQSELKRIITEKLVEHIEIENIEDFRIEQDMTTLSIYFTVILNDDESFDQEVSF